MFILHPKRHHWLSSAFVDVVVLKGVSLEIDDFRNYWDNIASPIYSIFFTRAGDWQRTHSQACLAGGGSQSEIKVSSARKAAPKSLNCAKVNSKPCSNRQDLSTSTASEEGGGHSHRKILTLLQTPHLIYIYMHSH